MIARFIKPVPEQGISVGERFLFDSDSRCWEQLQCKKAKTITDNFVMICKNNGTVIIEPFERQHSNSNAIIGKYKIDKNNELCLLRR